MTKKIHTSGTRTQFDFALILKRIESIQRGGVKKLNRKIFLTFFIQFVIVNENLIKCASYKKLLKRVQPGLQKMHFTGKFYTPHFVRDVTFFANTYYNITIML